MKSAPGENQYLGRALLPCILLVCAVSWADPATQPPPPARRALIIAARGGDDTDSAAVIQAASDARSLLIQAGFTPEAIETLSTRYTQLDPQTGPSTRQEVLTRIAALQDRLGPADELWVFVLGYANLNSKGLSIRTEGPRLRGHELADALDHVPGHQVVLCLCRQGAVLLPLLAKDKRVVISATDDARQLNTPVFTALLLKRWATMPEAPLLEVLRKTGEDTTASYSRDGLTPAERAMAHDGSAGASVPLEQMDEGRLAWLRLSTRTSANDWSLHRPATQPDADSQPASTRSAAEDDSQDRHDDPIRKEIHGTDPID